ncbi:MAG: alpha/beta hydrolase [Candidatus Omnitrophota bacterium]
MARDILSGTPGLTHLRPASSARDGARKDLERDLGGKMEIIRASDGGMRLSAWQKRAYVAFFNLPHNSSFTVEEYMGAVVAAGLNSVQRATALKDLRKALFEANRLELVHAIQEARKNGFRFDRNKTNADLIVEIKEKSGWDGKFRNGMSRGSGEDVTFFFTPAMRINFRDKLPSSFHRYLGLHFDGSAQDGGAKSDFNTLLFKLMRAAPQKDGGLERYDQALMQFALYLDQNENARHFLYAPFTIRRIDPFFDGWDDPVAHPPYFADTLERLARVARIGGRIELSDLSRQQLLSLLVASSWLWPQTRPRSQPEDATVLRLRGYKDVSLTGYFFGTTDTSQEKYPTVIMMPPYAQSVLILKDYARFLQENYNVNVLLLEMRHHGESGGSFLSPGQLESRDLSLVVEQLGKDASLRVDGEAIVGFGASWGARVWMEAEKEGLVKPKALILDALSPFEKNEKGEVVGGTEWSNFLYGLSREQVPKVVEIYSKIVRYYLQAQGIDVGKEEVFFDTRDRVPGIKTPSLILFEEQDSWSPPEMLETMRELTRKNPHLRQVLVQGGHARGFLEDPVNYQRALRDFLDGILPQRVIRPDRPTGYAQDGGDRSTPKRRPARGSLHRLIAEREKRTAPAVDVQEGTFLAEFAESHRIPLADLKKGIEDLYALYHLAVALRLYDDLQLEEIDVQLLFHYYLYPEWTTVEIGKAIGRSRLYVERHLFGREGAHSPYADFVSFLEERDPQFLSSIVREHSPSFSKEILDVALVQSPGLTDIQRKGVGKRIDRLLESETLSEGDKLKLITLKVFLGLETEFAPESEKRRTFEDTATILSITRKGAEKRIYGFIEKSAVDILREEDPKPEWEGLEHNIRKAQLEGEDRDFLKTRLNGLLQREDIPEADRKKLLALKVYLGFETDFSPESKEKRNDKEAAALLAEGLEQPVTQYAVRKWLWGSVQEGALDILGRWFEVDRENLHDLFYEQVIGETRRRLFREAVEREEGIKDLLLPSQRNRLEALWNFFQTELGNRGQSIGMPTVATVVFHRLEGKTSKEISELTAIPEVRVRQMTRELPDPPIPAALELVEERVKQDQFPFATAERYWRKRFLARPTQWMRWDLIPFETLAIWVERLSQQAGKPWEALTAHGHWDKIEVVFPDEARTRTLYQLYDHFNFQKRKEKDPDVRELTTNAYIIKHLAPYRKQAEEVVAGSARDGGEKLGLTPGRIAVSVHLQSPGLYP